MTRLPAIRRTLVRLLVCVAALAVPSAAFADCAHQIIDQAYQGKITGTYSQACYNAAIKIEPVDGSSYSDIDSIIKDAKRAAALAAQDSKVVSVPTTTGESPRNQYAHSPTSATTVSTSVTTTGGTKPTALALGGRVDPPSSSGTGSATATPSAPSATLLGAPSATPVLDRLAPAHAGDVPVAVIVLGVLAALLVLAGIAGAVLRRRSARSNL